MRSKEDLLSELNFLKDVFISNGYPKKLVEKTIKNSWKVELEKQLKALVLEQNEETHMQSKKWKTVDTMTPSISHTWQDLQRN